jgi:hypothetical protein
MEGSGFVKHEDPVLEVQNNCALAALMAEREAQDATLYKAWTDASSSIPPPILTVPLSDTCFQVDGHVYKIPDVIRAHEIEKSLEELTAARDKEKAKWAEHWTKEETVSIPYLQIEEL